MKKIIIAEKPLVGRAYAKTLGVYGNEDGYIENDEWIVTWCFGHLVTLWYPEDYDPELKHWKMETLPFLPEEYHYKVIEDVKNQFDVVKNLYHRNDVSEIYYAGDSGREGLYIQMLVRAQAGIPDGVEEKVVWISSQTEDEILRGIREAKPLTTKYYQDLMQAGYMRAIADSAIGINFSRALSIKYGNMYRSKSKTATKGVIRAGRVMSAVLAMIVERERTIKNFKAVPYYKIANKVSVPSGEISGNWKVTDDSKYKDSPLLYEEKGFREESSAKKMISELPQQVTIKSCKRKPVKKNAPMLFNLAELQAECSKLFKIGPDRTLEIAQSLYEKKLTTYPRTDARVLTTAIATEIKENISGIATYTATASYVSSILENGWYKGIEKTKYTDDSKVTDHYAIIPTGDITALEGLKYDEKGVYELIIRRFLSIFYPAAVYEQITIEMLAGTEHFFTSDKVLSTPGYLEVAGIPKADRAKKDLSAYEGIAEGDVFESAYGIDKGTTSPPNRYTSGSIILAMENAGNLIEDEELRAQIKGSGIGTSATRGEIYKKLLMIGYIQADKKTQVLTPTEDGFIIYDIMADVLPELLSPKMTAEWEQGLSEIENGEKTRDEYQKEIDEFVEERIEKIKEKNNGENYKGESLVMETKFRCPLCGGKVTYHKKYGYKCEHYIRKDEGCGFHIGPICGILIGDRELKALIEKGITRQIKGWVSKNGKKFEAALCMKKNKAENKIELSFDFETGKDKIICPKCGEEVREGPKGYFCSNYKNGCQLNGLWKKACWVNITANDVKQLLAGKTIEKTAKTKSGKSYKKKVAYDIDKGEIYEVKK